MEAHGAIWIDFLPSASVELLTAFTIIFFSAFFPDRGLIKTNISRLSHCSVSLAPDRLSATCHKHCVLSFISNRFIWRSKWRWSASKLSVFMFSRSEPKSKLKLRSILAWCELEAQIAQIVQLVQHQKAFERHVTVVHITVNYFWRASKKSQSKNHMEHRMVDRSKWHLLWGFECALCRGCAQVTSEYVQRLLCITFELHDYYHLNQF